MAPHAGRCHCGAVRFTVRVTGGLEAARRCNCSFCSMRGAVTLTAAIADLTVTAGAERLREYRFNTGVAHHFFCDTCGIYTHHRRRSNPTEFGVNAACLDGLGPFDFAAVPVFDGAHHSADTGRDVQVGTLRYEAAGD